jgi:two-component system chemotaxis response regulator CheB
MAANRLIKVLIVDDSAVVRKVLSELIDSADDLLKLKPAPDPIFALERMKEEWPDVIILDMEMPRMDGLTFLTKVMEERPTPIVVCSSLTEKNAQITMDALAAGAVAIVTKPKVGLSGFLQESADEILREVRAAARARLNRQTTTASAIRQQAPLAASYRTTDKLVAIGTSTGGTKALEEVLKALPKTSPGIVCVQHMPAGFTRAFAERLNSICNVEVLEASQSTRIIPGRVLIAPGETHMEIEQRGAYFYSILSDGPPVCFSKPSVDVLFQSVARNVGQNALGIILTGMGKDGAEGLLAMRRRGARTIAQDEASSVVYGMPKVAFEKGAAERVLPLFEVPEAIMNFYTQQADRAPANG